MTPTPDQILQFGRPGDPVAGSRLVRAYCHNCGEPIRVTYGVNLNTQECHNCVGTFIRKTIMQPRSIRTQTRGPIRSEPCPPGRGQDCSPQRTQSAQRGAV